MASRGRGIRSRRIEPPRPRKTTSQSSLDGSLEVERLMVDKMICSLEDGAISPNEANSLNLMLKSSGLLLEISDRDYMQHIVNVLRRCLKTMTLSPVVRMSLLESLELAVQGWESSPDTELYYQNKYNELNVTQNTSPQKGGLQRGISVTSINSDNYETASEGGTLSRQNSTQTLDDVGKSPQKPAENSHIIPRSHRVTNDVDLPPKSRTPKPQRGPLAQRQISEPSPRNCELVSIIKPPVSTSSPKAAVQGRSSSSSQPAVSSPIGQVLEATSTTLSPGSIDTTQICDKLSELKVERSKLRSSPTASNSSITSPNVSLVSMRTSFSSENGGGDNITMAYTIDVGNHVLRLQCTSEEILQEALNVVSSHFADKKYTSRNKTSPRSLSFDSSSARVSDPNNNPPVKTMDASLLPLPDDIWSDSDDACFVSEIHSYGASGGQSPPYTRSVSDRVMLRESEVAPHSTSIAGQSHHLSAADFRRTRSVSGLTGDSKDNYGFRQPINVIRAPLNPLATMQEIRYIEVQPESSIYAANRRNFFSKSNQNRLQGLANKGQKVLQYGVKFLLECASSPLAKNPPNEWQGRRDLPGVCLHKSNGFNPFLFKTTMECIPYMSLNTS